jgi:hypothetical protein
MIGPYLAPPDLTQCRCDGENGNGFPHIPTRDTHAVAIPRGNVLARMPYGPSYLAPTAPLQSKPRPFLPLDPAVLAYSIQRQVAAPPESSRTLNPVSAVLFLLRFVVVGLARGDVDGEQAAGPVLRAPARRQGRLAAGGQGGVPEPGAAVAPRQAPAGVQAPGRGAVQGHHRGLRGVTTHHRS